MCITLLGPYWAVLGPELRTGGTKQKPGAQSGARAQPGLFQGGRNVGYKSACRVLEMDRDGLRRRPDTTPWSPPLQQTSIRSRHIRIEASENNLESPTVTLANHRRPPGPATCARLTAGHMCRVQAQIQQPLGSLVSTGGSGLQIRGDTRRWIPGRPPHIIRTQLTYAWLTNVAQPAWGTV